MEAEVEAEAEAEVDVDVEVEVEEGAEGFEVGAEDVPTEAEVWEFEEGGSLEREEDRFKEEESQAAKSKKTGMLH